MLPTWFMVGTEANGLSGGLATLWDPTRVRAKAYKCCAGIIIAASIRGCDFPINIINIYASYKSRVPFWKRIFATDLFDIDHLLIAGDLNAALKSEEVWGQGKLNNALADLINFEMLNRNMVDITLVVMKPTWTNGRVGKAYIAKRLYRFIAHINLLDKMGMPSSSVENIIISDHNPILLTWPGNQFRRGYSFKFDRGLLQDSAFNEYIQNAWKVIKDRDKLFIFSTFREKVAEIRRLVKKWQIQKLQKDRRDLQRIQQELDLLLGSTNYASFSIEMKCRLRNLEKEKLSVLQ